MNPKGRRRRRRGRLRAVRHRDECAGRGALRFPRGQFCGDGHLVRVLQPDKARDDEQEGTAVKMKEGREDESATQLNQLPKYATNKQRAIRKVRVTRNT